MPDSSYADMIAQAEQQYGIPSGLLRALLTWESGLNPLARGVNPGGSVDRGIAQINSRWHPEVSDAEAYNPQYAIPWAAQYLAQLHSQCGDWPEAVQAYNVGHCAAPGAYAQHVLSLWQGAPAAASAGGRTAAQAGAAPAPERRPSFWSDPMGYLGSWWAGEVRAAEGVGLVALGLILLVVAVLRLTGE